MFPYSNQTTSKKAARTASRRKAETDRENVFAYIKANKPIDEETQIALGLNGNTERPRRRELVQAGRVVDSGLTRKTKQGHDATIWVAKEDA